MTKQIKLEFPIPTPFDDGLVNTDLSFSKKELITFLTKNWIPYMECHHCGKSDYCKFAQPHPVNPYKKKEIRCGVVSQIIENIISINWKRLNNMSQHELELFINGIYNVAQFSGYSETYIGQLVNSEFITSYKEMNGIAISAFGRIRKHLDSAAKNFSELEGFNIEHATFYVEGESEEALLKEYSKNLFLDNHDLKTYSGKDRIKKGKYQLLEEELSTIGKTLFIQGDRDGQNSCYLDDLIRQNKLEKKQVFLFEHDLESSYPLNLLHLCLQKLSLLSRDVTLEEFQSAIDSISDSMSISKKLIRLYDVDISNYKVIIAKQIGLLVKHHYSSHILLPDICSKNELYQFLFWFNSKHHFNQ